MKILIVIAIIYGVTYGYPAKCTCSSAKSEDNPKSITDYGYGRDGAFLSHTQTLVDNDNYKLDATAYANKNFHDRTPLVTGGNLDLGHKRTRSEVNLNVENTRHMGTDVTAGGQYNFFNTQDGRAKIGVYGEYSTHLGGPSGNTDPQLGYGVRGSANF